MATTTTMAATGINWVGKLQEMYQGRRGCRLPTYDFIKIPNTPDHMPLFRCDCLVGARKFRANGVSHKDAKQKAAQKAFIKLKALQEYDDTTTTTTTTTIEQLAVHDATIDLMARILRIVREDGAMTTTRITDNDPRWSPREISKCVDAMCKLGILNERDDHDHDDDGSGGGCDDDDDNNNNKIVAEGDDDEKNLHQYQHMDAP